jgi:HSP20 family protein
MTGFRIDPFREFDRLAEHAWGRSRPVPAMDAWRRSDDVIVQFDLPGVDPDSIEVTVEKGMLTVGGERRPMAAEGDEPVVRERPIGQFARRVVLGDGLDVSRVTATYELGVLTVTLPRHEEVKPRRIEVNRPAERTAIDTVSHPTAQPDEAREEATAA